MDESLNQQFENYYSNMRNLKAAKAVDVCYKILGTAIEKRLENAEKKENKGSKEYIAAAVAYIDEHLDNEDLSIVSVATHVYLNPVYFGRVFKNTFHMTFKQYLLQRRMELAKRLLEDGRTSIGNICEQVGISNPSYFSHLFKEYTGHLKYMCTLLILALVLSSICVWTYVRRNMTDVIVDKYEFMNEKMGIALDNLYRKTDAVTAEIILENDVQKSLRNKELQEVEKNALSKYFAYIDLNHVADYCYIDNKRNVYEKSYSQIGYSDFQSSGLREKMGDEYAKTQWIWTRDYLFGTGDEALFIGRYVNSMDYAHEPGIVYLKMNQQFLESVMDKDRKIAKDVAVGIISPEGKTCIRQEPEDLSIEKRTMKKITELTRTKKSGVIVRGKKIEGGILQAYRQEETGMVIFTLVPDMVLNQGMTQILIVLLTIYAVIAVLAFVLSLYASQTFTRPIRQISDAMTSFDGNDFTHTIQIHTDTELDKIGHAYNEMLKNIEEFQNEVKNQQKELRISEMNTLISQINPHFLYNTLDTIYMLARINGEEKTMKMIQALSKYLRLSLSKGREIVTVEDELENVKSYMEIQQIRNENLFRYEIECAEELKTRWILKLILQPIVENAVKYGFCDIFEGGLIRISVTEQAGQLTFSVYNNGTPMEEQMAEKLNGLSEIPVSKMKDSFEDKKHGYGVINIITRLRLKYGEDVRFFYESDTNGTVCVIQIPDDGKENSEQ